MHSKKSQKNTGHNSVSNAFLNIVGQNMLQNELLLSFLKEETGLKGAYFPKLESIPHIDANEPAIPQLIILDCRNIDMGNIWADIRKWNCSNSWPYFFVVCNAEHDLQFEKSAMNNGIQGIFYNNDSLKLISKGICAILNGDLWYSRETLKKLFAKKRSSSNFSFHPEASHLTSREKTSTFLYRFRIQQQGY